MEGRGGSETNELGATRRGVWHAGANLSLTGDMAVEDLRRSPFKVARIESDPTAFGRRVTEVRACASALFNRRHILISGPRGIGKSSLGSQLQTAYGGNNTLLRRCAIDTPLPRYLCAFYACDSTTTLGELCSEILFSLEREFLALRSVRTDKAKVTVELNLGFLKTKLESDIVTRRPATLATDLVVGLAEVLRSARLVGMDGINVMLDEVDLLPATVNFGHFLKVVHETLGREELTDVTFILAGQMGIYGRLLDEDASVERHMRHVPLSVLEPDESRYVLEYAADHGDPPFAVSTSAAEMILSLAAGYPYDIHLIGDAAFAAMVDPDRMGAQEVLRGLGELFQSDKREKYLERLRALSEAERLVLVSLARYSDKRIPMRIPLKWLEGNLLGQIPGGGELHQTLTDLAERGYLVINADLRYCQFSEELLRIFISLLLIDQRESRARRDDREAKRQEARVESQKLENQLRFVRDLQSQGVDKKKIEFALEVLEQAEYTADWDDDSSFLLTGPST